MDIGRDPVATPQRIRGLSRRGAAPPDERPEPGGLLRDYEPGPNLCSIRGLHRSSLFNVSLFGSCPAERQHRRLATLGLVVESLAMAPASPLLPPLRRAPRPGRGNEAGAGSAQNARTDIRARFTAPRTVLAMYC